MSATVDRLVEELEAECEALILCYRPSDGSPARLRFYHGDDERVLHGLEEWTRGTLGDMRETRLRVLDVEPKSLAQSFREFTASYRQWLTTWPHR